MLKSSPKAAGLNAVFYKSEAVGKEVRAGYLFKSPPPGPLKRAWKQRFFVLTQTSEREHTLEYFKSPAEKDKPLGVIDLTQVSVLFQSPQSHPKWTWIHKHFRCSPCCVFLLKACEREYFLIGETSDEVEDWFSDIFRALKDRPHKVLNPEEMYQESTLNIEVNADTFLALAVKKREDPLLRVYSSRRRTTNVIEPETPSNVKRRTVSDPVVPNYFSSEIEKTAERTLRPLSEPMEFDSLYDYPRPFLRNTAERNLDQTEMKEDDASGCNMSIESVDSKGDDHTVSTLMRSVTTAFVKLKTQTPPLPLSDDDSLEDRETSSSLSHGSTENEEVSPVELQTEYEPFHLGLKSSTESFKEAIPEEKDIIVNQAAIKKHLTLTEVDGRPCVSAWTGSLEARCLFHKRDQILAINDLHIDSLEEYHTYLSKLLKSQAKLTILRLPGCQPLHAPLQPCE